MLLEAKVDEKISREDFDKLIEANKLMSEHIMRLEAIVNKYISDLNAMKLCFEIYVEREKIKEEIQNG